MYLVIIIVILFFGSWIHGRIWVKLNHCEERLNNTLTEIQFILIRTSVHIVCREQIPLYKILHCILIKYPVSFTYHMHDLFQRFFNFYSINNITSSSSDM